MPRSPSLFPLGAAQLSDIQQQSRHQRIARKFLISLLASRSCRNRSLITSWMRGSQHCTQEAAVLLDELDRSKIFADFAPLEVMGSHISGPVIDDRVRTPEQFRGWLAEHGLSQS